MGHIVVGAGQLPPCTFPVNGRCNRTALYGFRLRGWPESRKAPVCAAHAIAVRFGPWDVDALWLATQPVPSRAELSLSACTFSPVGKRPTPRQEDPDDDDRLHPPGDRRPAPQRARRRRLQGGR